MNSSLIMVAGGFFAMFIVGIIGSLIAIPGGIAQPISQTMIMYGGIFAVAFGLAGVVAPS